MSLTIQTQYGDNDRVLTDKALALTEALEKRFGQRRKALLAKRTERQAELDAGGSLDFLPETQAIRDGDWQVVPVPEDIADRRVEITGPVDRKMVINALNSGAKVFMADFEDAHSPTWQATIDGQVNLADAMRRTITFTSPEGKNYQLNDELATLMVRVRGLHLEEKNVLLDGNRISGCFFDLAVFLVNNADYALANDIGLYFYVPKLESHLEARLWNDVFNFAEDYLELPRSTLRCTVLIETIPAAFEMDEILYELREHIVALNAGRWDYIFNFIKRFRNHSDKVLPDRAEVTMMTHFLRSYSQLLIQTCHKRGAHAMGGMAAQIPIKDDEEANRIAFDKVRADKIREAGDGHDGTWVAHPGLVPVALEVFNEYMPEANQVNKTLAVDNKTFSAEDLLQVPKGNITAAGVYTNVAASLRYLMAWLLGSGAVPIFNLMEDAATAEISRAQLWQWVRQDGLTTNDTNETITLDYVKSTIDKEVEVIRNEVPASAYHALSQAAELIYRLVAEDEFTEFLTLPAYELI
ncbi:MAG: malate synthase A [Gammaproteobacteria bacterium]|nr:MAG: malate synthase A [Gammaproteobacteria bacterium]